VTGRAARAKGSRAEPQHAATDWSAVQYQPAEGTPLLRCWCGAAFLADEPGRRAHLAVFGHRPRSSKPAKRADGPQPDPQEEP
jgi:hypothetical protein